MSRMLHRHYLQSQFDGGSACFERIDASKHRPQRRMNRPILQRWWILFSRQSYSLVLKVGLLQLLLQDEM
jgi:hypothetical protein